MKYHATASDRARALNRGELRSTNRIVARAVSLALAGTLVCARGAVAQEAPNPAADQKNSAGDTGDTLQQVVVTGSRITRTGFETPTPETVISQAELQAKAFTNVTELVNDIPQLVPQVSYGGGITNTGYNSFNLRGLGATRTLVLIDGRRVADSSPLGGFDIDVLPAGLIKNIDVVTGGASAAYGSDAVSGVVNIQLDDQFEGFKTNVQAGETIYHDSKDLDANALYGTSFDSGRGHFVFAVDELTNDGATSQGTRPWGDQGYAILANPAYVAGSNNGQPRNLILPDTTLSKMTNGGVIVSPGPLQNIQFGPGGVPEPYYPGANAGGSFATGGDGGSFAPFANLSQAVHRTSAFTRVSYDVNDKLTVYADVLYARTSTFYDVIPNYDNGDIVITQQNAFLPASIRQTMVADNIQSVLMGRTNVDMGGDNGMNQANGLNEVGRYAFGVKGKIAGSWTWDAVIQYTGNHYYDPTGQNRLTQNWLNSIDSIISPTTGAPICRSTLTHPGNGCVPVNLFGPNTISPAVVDYVTGTSWEDSRQWQDYGGFNVQGEPVSDWAGPISVAMGAEARHEALHGDSDPISQMAGWRQGNPQPVAGSYDVKEGYLETVVPLAANLPGAKLLEFNGAVRETDYSTSGSVDTWKLGLNYKPVDDLRLRGTVSRDIRAPDINELFATRNQQITQVTDRTTNVTSNAQILTGGNPDLKPEIGKTITGGFVYTPAWLETFSASVDYYNITIDGAISTLPAQTVIDDCYQGQTSLCSNITRSPTTGLISSVFSSAFNAQQLKTNGFDIEAAYDWRLNTLFANAGGDIRFRYIATFVNELTTVVDGVATNTAGQPTLQGTGGVPHWRMNLTSSYGNGPWTVTMLERWVQGGVYNSTYVQGIDINNNNVVGRFYTDLSVQYAATSQLAVYVKVNNLFNISPPIVPNSLTEPYTASSPFYDVLGTTWAVGFRFNL
jgi:iron complex outermembrane recepter protein